MELLKDYDCTIDYHPGKANIVADALSRKTVDQLAGLICYNMEYLTALRAMDVHFSICGDILLATTQVKPSLKDKIKDAQARDPYLQRMKAKVKAENQAPAGKLHPLTIHEWKWEKNTMDFVIGLPHTFRRHDAIWVIVDRLTKSAHFLPIRQNDSLDKLAELYVSKVVRLHGIPTSIVSNRDPRFTSHFWGSLQTALGPELVQETVDKIKTVKTFLKAAQDRQKSYVDKHHREMEYEVREKVFLKVSPWRGILRFGKYMTCFTYLWYDDTDPDPSHNLHEPEMEISEGLTYVEEPMEILNRSIKKLRNKEIPMVKVKWSHHSLREATWEVEENMREKYHIYSLNR
ncbi:UNVERIFIED_CONTAM: Transposon Tf2-11 polyprotein [Sesamum indicum]